ncbi:acyl-CoA dehydrogenase family protein [Deinococcus sonorensis]|uniref:Acyl-CoA dehydrogenase family protein n=2 Tax=Deinococcus sonorensis TaxID=309891 RepID=A0AAU7U669_9DEIO
MLSPTLTPDSPWRFPDALLDRCHQRAPVYDRENRFFSEDFEELRDAGYLKLALPAALGGAGLSLAGVCAAQRRLAYHAPATALGLSMHLYWTGMAAELSQAGDPTLRWLLEEVAAGEVLASGHAEAGNDLPIVFSSARAERQDGGYRLWGRKQFGSLSPVWTRLGLHALDATIPDQPAIIHAFLPRDTPGSRIEWTWDALGMRATRSDDTVLDGAFIPDRYVARRLPAGTIDAEPFMLSLYAWPLLQFAAVYLGLAERARDLAITSVRTKTSVALGGRRLAHHPEVQHRAAELTMTLDAMVAHLDVTLRDWTARVPHDLGWPAKIVATKYHCVQGAQRVVDLALDLSGGGGLFRQNELERLYRDVRCGAFHPANAAVTHELVGKTALGVLGADGARWG